MSLELFLGYTASGVPITAPEASNPHIFVTGRSGSGKSYFLRGLLPQASRQGTQCLVFDYTGDFCRYTPPSDISFQRISVTSPAFSLNPLLGCWGQSPEARAQQFLSQLHCAFRMGTRKSLALRKAVIRYLHYEAGLPTLEKLIAHIKEGEDDNPTAVTALEFLELLDTVILCGSDTISLNLSAAGITILDFTEVLDLPLRNLLLSMTLLSVWEQRVSSFTGTEHPLMLLLDEAQTLPWSENGMATRILREGRKFGVGGWFASQWISNKNAVAALGQAALQVHFRPDDANIPALAKRLAQSSAGQSEQWQRLLWRLQVGQFVFSQRNGQAVVVNVPP